MWVPNLHIRTKAGIKVVVNDLRQIMTLHSHGVSHGSTEIQGLSQLLHSHRASPMTLPSAYRPHKSTDISIAVKYPFVKESL